MARHCSIILCAAVAALVALGLIMLASTSAWVKGVEEPYHFLTRQSIMVVVGLVAAVIARGARAEICRKFAPGLSCRRLRPARHVLRARRRRRELRIQALDQDAACRPVPTLRDGQDRGGHLSRRVVRALADRGPHVLARICRCPESSPVCPSCLIAGETDVGIGADLVVSRWQRFSSASAPA